MIAKITGETYFNEGAEEVLKAVDLLYRARLKAISSLAEFIFAEDVDLTEREISICLDGVNLEYDLCIIHHLGDEINISRSEMSTIKNISNLKLL